MRRGSRFAVAHAGARRTPSIVPREMPGIQALLGLQVAVVVIAAMYFGAEILIPVVLSVLLSFLLQPLNALLRRAHLGRVPAVLLSVVLALALLGGLFWLIGWQLMGLTQTLAADGATIERKVAAMRSLLGGSGRLAGIGSVQEQLGHLLAGSAAAPAAPAHPPGSPSGSPAVHLVQVVSPPETPVMLVRQVLGRLAHPLVTALVVFVVTIFVLLQREDLRDRLIRLFGTRDLHRTTLALDDAGARLSRYFLTQLAINTCFGAVIAGGLFLIGVPSPVLWGILAALLRYVPYVGLLFAALLPVLLAAAAFDGWDHAALTFALYLVVDQVLGQFIEPMLVGHSTGLSPLSVVLAATFWAFLWGPIGLILSTPLTLCAVVLGRHVEQLHFLDVLLGDTPPLSPVESLYQRLLAGDPDETEDQAETLLKQMTLADYYDEVVIEALRLAVIDAERDVLDADRLAGIARVLESLLDELETHEESAAVAGRLDRTDPSVPDAWRLDTAVLCVPGAFALDRIAARMMAQVLRRHGIGATVADAGRGGSLDADNATMLCLCTAGLQTRLSPARYAVRRLRRQAPGRTVVVAYWRDGTEDGEQRDSERARQAVAADETVEGTQAMVRLCQEAVRSATEAAGRAPPAAAPDAMPESAVQGAA